MWCRSGAAGAQVNNTMQQLTSVMYSTSEQYKDLSKSRQAENMADTRHPLSFLEQRNPFDNNTSLRNIVSGVAARAGVNSDQAIQIEEATF